ncbi:MAG: hypothetical protein C4560_06810 [Nitrospiraceae bacterium]|nr:MAG: hypothetical protein C4560_06810 [Nitrospiraceae bacterium]
MIKKSVIALAALLIMNVNISEAEDKWEIDIKANLNNAENILTIGTSPDASDGPDGGYDVPALLSGDIRAYLKIEDKQYWKDIKGSDGMSLKTWTFSVESNILRQTVKLKWTTSAIPTDTNLFLMDKVTGKTVDMKNTASIQYKNTGSREFLIEMRIR